MVAHEDAHIIHVLAANNLTKEKIHRELEGDTRLSQNTSISPHTSLRLSFVMNIQYTMPATKQITGDKIRGMPCELQCVQFMYCKFTFRQGKLTLVSACLFAERLMFAR